MSEIVTNFYSYFRSYITPGWKEWTYCNGLIMANNTFWSNIFQKYYSKLDNKFLEFLACAKNYTVIIHYIDLLKSGNFTTARERITVFHSIIARQVKNDVVFEYIINNFDQIVPRYNILFINAYDLKS